MSRNIWTLIWTAVMVFNALSLVVLSANEFKSGRGIGGVILFVGSLIIFTTISYEVFGQHDNWE